MNEWKPCLSSFAVRCRRFSSELLFASAGYGWLSSDFRKMAVSSLALYVQNTTSVTEIVWVGRVFSEAFTIFYVFATRSNGSGNRNTPER